MPKSRKPSAVTPPSNGHTAPEPSPVCTVPLLLRPKHVAKLLAVSRPTVYAMVRRGDLEAFQVGDALKVSERSVLAYLSAHPFRVQL